MAEITDKLTVVWDARFDELEKKLDGVNRAVHGTADKIEKRWKQANDNIADSSSKSVGGLREFGAASLAAAAGASVATAAVGALVFALADARAAAAFSAELKNTAEKVHLTTDALQEYQYALDTAGGKAEDADDAFNSFSETLGDAQRGVKKAKDAFLQLGFTPEQIKNMTDADTALKSVTERIQGLPTTEQDAIIKALGLEKIAPLIRLGGDEMQRLRDEAHKVGVVMDAELVKRGAQLDEQFNTVAKVIDIQLKSALVDLGPIIVDLLGLLARMARAAADVADAFRSVQNKSNEGLRKQIAQLEEQRKTGRIKPTLADRAVGAIPIVGGALEAGRLANRANKTPAQIDAEIASLKAELNSRASANTAPPVAPTRRLADTSKPPKVRKGPTDKTAQAQERVEQAELAVERALLSAWSDLLVGAENRADVAKLILDVEKAEYESSIDKQIADINSANNIKKAEKAGLIARLEANKLEYKKVDDLKRELIDRELVERKAQDALAIRQSEFEAQEEALRIADSLARTQAERRDLELKLLDLSDQRVIAEQEAIKASKTATAAEKQIAQNKIDALKATRGSRERRVREDTAGPLESFFDKLPKDVDEVNEAFERLYADGISNFIDGTAEAIAGMRSFKSVLVSTIQQMAVEANRVLLKSLFRQVFGGVLGGGTAGPQGSTPANPVWVQVAPGVGGLGGATDITGQSIPVDANEWMLNLGDEISLGGQGAAKAIDDVFRENSGGGFVGALQQALSSLGGGGGGSGGLFKTLLNIGGSLFGGSSLGGLKAASGGLTEGAVFIPKFASGTNSARGGLSLIGERGPELLNIPKGAQVIPNDILRNLSRQRSGAASYDNRMNLSVVVHAAPGMTARDARRTGAQVAGELQTRLAMAKRSGF